MTPLYLIAYDIADRKRLGQVHRFLRARALALQYSVFLAPCDESGLAGIVAGLRARVDERHDDVRIYRLPERCQPRTLGRQVLPPGLFLGGHVLLDRFQPRAIELPLEEGKNLAAGAGNGRIERP